MGLTRWLLAVLQRGNIPISPRSSCGSLRSLVNLDASVLVFMVAGVPCLQNVTAATAHTKDKEGDLSKPSKDGEQAKARAPSDPQANVFVLRKMVEEVFTVLYSKKSPAACASSPQRSDVPLRRLCACVGEALGKSSLLPVPYDAILKEPGCVVAHGLPDGVALKKPCEYDTKTLMKILEQSHRIQFSVSR